MPTLHKEILTKAQTEILPIITLFRNNFGLVGGTAIALHIGHRESIDFDMFSSKEFGNISIRNKITKKIKIDKVYIDELGEFTFRMNGVKTTFFHYPFIIKFSENFGYSIRLPNLLTLAAMKAYALGRRQKWKDYVDLYFIMRDFYKISEIAKKAESIFGKEFNERNFREQLACFDGIDYSDKIIWKQGFEVSDEEIKKALIEFSLGQ